MRGLMFGGAMLLLLPQALWVRRRAPRFAPAAGPAAGSVGTGDPLHLVGIGDSIIAGVGAGRLTDALVGRVSAALASRLGGQIRWTAVGKSGAKAAVILEELAPQLPATGADIFVVSVGVNDVTGLTRRRIWRADLEALMRALRQHSPQAIIAVAGLPPLHRFPLLPEPLRTVLGMRARVLDAILAEVVSATRGALYVPMEFDAAPDKFAADGYHPSEQGYAEYGAELASRMLASPCWQQPAEP